MYNLTNCSEHTRNILSEHMSEQDREETVLRMWKKRGQKGLCQFISEAALAIRRSHQYVIWIMEKLNIPVKWVAK